jgi:hypothetical protein
MATPQCAIAQPGSCSRTRANACVDASNQKEWSIATARPNSSATAGRQDVGNSTLPTCSEPGWVCATTCAAASRAANVTPSASVRTIMTSSSP